MDVQKKQLTNGLVVATEVMPHLRSVSIGVWVRGGSRCEDEHSSGISHFIEHMLFKGTSSRSAEDIAKAVDSIGGQLNAFTDKEYVGFYAKVQDKHLDLAFELLADIVLHPSFPAAEMRRERNVILEEISMIEDSPAELVQDVFMENFWGGHALGRPVTGTRESVGRMTRRQIHDHFRKYYAARNTIVSAAGNIRHRQVQELAARHFADLAEGEPADPGMPPRPHARHVVRHKPHLEQTHLCLGTSCPPMRSRQRYCAHILNSLLGGGMSSRLFQNIREKRGLVYTIYSMPNLFADTGTLLVYAGAAPKKAAMVLELMLAELRRLRESPVSFDELRRARENIKGAVVLSLESSCSRMTHIAQQEIYFGRFYTMREIMNGFDRVCARDVQRLANEIFDPAGFTLSALTSDNMRDLESVRIRV